MGRLDGKVAIVTGAASGIGAATVRRLAAEAAAVLAVDIDEGGGEEVAAAVRSEGHVAEFRRADVASLPDVEATVSSAVERFGGVDIVHNNAFWSGGGYVHELDPDEWDRTLRVCLTGVMYGMRAAIPAMLERGGGSIVNMGSIDGFYGEAFASPYSAAKAGVINLTRAAANEYGRVGIRVNAVCPGIVDTPAVALVEKFAPGYRARAAAASALGRIIDPDEIARLVLFLAGDESAAITGTAVTIDAGLTARHPTPAFPPYER